MIFRNRGLALLLRLKLRGTLRKQVRRLRTPSGALFGLLGLLLMGLWIASLLFGWRGELASRVDDELRLPAARAIYFCLGLVTLASSLNHRGLYVPREEIERLFSAPIERRDIVRYRLVANLGRALIGAVILGLAARGMAPDPLYGFLGACLTVLTLPVVGQLLSILAGSAESRFLSRLPKKTLRTLTWIAGIAIWAAIFAAFVGDDWLGELLARAGLERGAGSLFEHPLARWTTWPLHPWAAMTMATDAATFLRYGAFCGAFGALCFVGASRLPIDFRELSLATSADVARRIRRVSRGGLGASAGRASTRTAGWRLPWVFGRGPYGAIAWRKLLGIVRKARGTVLTSLAVVVFVTILSSSIGAEGLSGTIASGLMIALFGTVYLSGLLRFDYRDELEQMQVIKAWPVEPARAFAAMLLPQALLISAVVAFAQLLRHALSGGSVHVLVGLIGLQPLLAFTFAALDNMVFLYAPVRYVPGQDGALHHSGRMVVMLLAKGLVLALILGLVGGVVFAITWAAGAFGLERHTAALAALGGSAVLVGTNLVLVRLGGSCLRRFDVARDRG